MIVCVLGSGGFLGTHLIKSLERHGEIHRIFAVNRKDGYTPESINKVNGKKVIPVHAELNIEQYVSDIFNAIKPDIVFHTAAIQKNTPETYENNTKITNYVLKYIPKGTRVIYVSSSTVYGNKAIALRRVKEKCLEGHRLEPTSLYGASKVADEAVVRVHTLAEKISSVIVRPCAIIGVGATHGALQDIIRKAAEPGDTLELWGDEPGSVKPYVHVDDLVSALITFGLDKKFKNIYNICPDDEISINQLADIVMATLKVNKKKVWLGATKLPLGDNKLVAMSNELAVEEGWQRKYKTSAEGIASVTKEWKELNG